MARLRPIDAERRRQSDAGPDFSEALARGLQIMAAFSEDRRQMSLSDVARVVDLPRATVRRALHTLTYLGYVETDGRLHRLTPRILRLASAYLTSNTVTTVLQPACERIAREVGESCTAAVLQADEVVMIARALPAQLLPVGAGIGYRLPAYCSALGRVLLAALPDDTLTAYLARTEFVEITPYTVTDPAWLKEEILRVRAAGFAFVDQEAEYGFRSIAVTLRKFDGTSIAALNIGVRSERATAEVMFGSYLTLLREAAEELRPQLI
ncbi:MAG TPA: IclR family transcriptional regulator C-terminal domain-containing protein [Stellaceae bacterium]|nr:IclR family transcriptional regulator C-terminal domain-containing protein [Stellaceae bacterium]